jgi:adenylylsulfate kinase-like enzyme
MKFDAKVHERFPVVWLTGNSGAGKSTLAFGMRDYFNDEAHSGSPLARRIIVLDGDEMRATVSVDEGFSPEDRRRHNLRVARLAKLFSDHGFLVIVSVIAPFQKVRDELQPICDPTWVYVKRTGLEANDRPYEPPTDPAFMIDSDEVSIEQGQEAFRSFLESLPVQKKDTKEEVGVV